MNNFLSRSLAMKIIATAAAATLMMIIITYGSTKQIGEKALYETEIEKASFIAETFSQLLSVNLFLGLDNNVAQLAKQLYDNKNVLSVTIISNGKTMLSLPEQAPRYDADNIISIRHDILGPNDKRVIGELQLNYSSLHYIHALQEYQRSAVISVVILLFILLILSVYYYRLLMPLRIIRNILRTYKPEASLYFPYTERYDEIGLISSAFNSMHAKVLDYNKLQHDINHKLEMKVAEKTKEIQHRLYFDSLTNLPNRVALIEALLQCKSGALLVINIDDFKEVNDFFGHTSGDMLLVEFSNLLCSKTDMIEHSKVYRLHGDEFAIHIDARISEAALADFLEKILQRIDTMQFTCEETRVSISATVGMTLDMNSALEKADIALKSAKKQGKTQLLYDERYSIEQEYRSNIIWVRKLKHAIDKERLIPFFQPIFDNRSGEIVSYESLIRLKEEDGSIVPPGHFMGIVKKAKLSDKLTQIVIEQSCRQFAERDANFSVNLSVDDINNDATVAFIKERIAFYGVARKITFEILETEGIVNYQSVANFIGQVHSMGCKVAIDDFGSGYSNFEHMMKLHVDYIKIDGSLIQNIDHDEYAKIIVQTIVDFANKLGIATIAEYVHNESVFETVKALQIDRSQGFFLAKPAPLEAMESV
jgi:diguanylate cyclase (GGDEF)-like protein